MPLTKVERVNKKRLKSSSLEALNNADPIDLYLHHIKTAAAPATTKNARLPPLPPKLQSGKNLQRRINKEEDLLQSITKKSLRSFQTSPNT